MLGDLTIAVLMGSISGVFGLFSLFIAFKIGKKYARDAAFDIVYELKDELKAVSYTHLTLPTILLV